MLDKAFEFAGQALNSKISKKTIQIVKHSRSTFLYTESGNCNRTPWVKQTGLFDVTQGAPDGAEVCELVGLMILNSMKNHFPELNIGLYRDDGLAVHEKLSGPKLDSIRKKLHAVFKDLGLRITVETNKKYVDFLDVSFNINDRSHAPYRKPNDRPLYINVDSNHPSTIIKNIPQNINKRLTQISSSEKEFNEAVRPYNEALKKVVINKFYILIKIKKMLVVNMTPKQMKKKQRKKDK